MFNPTSDSLQLGSLPNPHESPSRSPSPQPTMSARDPRRALFGRSSRDTQLFQMVKKTPETLDHVYDLVRQLVIL